jgi:hypothetical protein
MNLARPLDLFSERARRRAPLRRELFKRLIHVPGFFTDVSPELGRTGGRLRLLLEAAPHGAHFVRESLAQHGQRVNARAGECGGEPEDLGGWRVGFTKM